jgi:hypothetical protein
VINLAEAFKFCQRRLRQSLQQRLFNLVLSQPEDTHARNGFKFLQQQQQHALGACELADELALFEIKKLNANRGKSLFEPLARSRYE